MMFFKKGLGAVVATSLVLVVAVLGVVQFEGWYDSFSAEKFVEVETKSGVSSGGSKVGINNLIGTNLYLNLGDNTTVNSVSIGNSDCSISGNYSGIQSFGVAACLYGKSSPVSVKMITDSDIYEKSFAFDEEFDYDITPDAFNFPIKYGFVGLVNSSSEIITNFDGEQNVVLSSTRPVLFRVNGGSWIASGTISSGDTLEIQMDSLDLVSNFVDITIGDYTTTWEVRNVIS